MAELKQFSVEMRTSVTFRSSKFPPCEGEEDQLNPGLWGKRLAEYLEKELNKLGVQTQPMNPEDWGWYLPITNPDFRLALCCGHQDGDADEFLCFTEPATPFVRKLFKKIDTTTAIGQLTDAVDRILTSDADIRNVEWNNDE